MHNITNDKQNIQWHFFLFVPLSVPDPPKLTSQSVALYSNPGDTVSAYLEVMAYPTPVSLECSMDHITHVIILNDSTESNDRAIFTKYDFMWKDDEQYGIELKFSNVYGIISCYISNENLEPTYFEIISKLFCELFIYLDML